MAVQIPYVMDAQMTDIPVDGILDKILIFRNNALNLESKTLTRKVGTLGAILIVGKGDNFTDFDQISGLESIPGATETVKHVMKNVTLTGLGSNDLDINALTLVNLDATHEFDKITVNDSQDDGIEIFGGSVKMSNITVQDALDDYFDTDHGHSGDIINLNLIQTDGSKGKSLVECGNSKGSTTTKFVNLSYKKAYNSSSYVNNGSDKKFNIKSGSQVVINDVTLTEPQDELPLAPGPLPCFHEDVELLCYDEVEEKEVYKKVKDILVGDLVKTFACENMYSRVKYHRIRYLNEVEMDRDLDILYQHKEHNDIKITGRHSMIYDKGGALNYSGKTDRFVEGRYAKFFYNKIKPLQCMDKISTLPVHMDENFEPYKDTVPYVHMICVENTRPNVSVGLYLKNGLYCESTNEYEMRNFGNAIVDYEPRVQNNLSQQLNL